MNAWPTATISSFEQVPAASTVTLLRVAVLAQVDVDADELRPALVADDGVTVTRFAAIPAPLDAGRTIRAAYAVPDDLVAETTRFSLECDDGSVLSLPAPVKGAHRMARATRAPADLEDDDRRSALGPKLAELTEELASARHEAIGLRDDAGAAERMQAELSVAHREAAELRAELLALGDLARISSAADESEAAPLREQVAELRELVDEAQRGREAAEAERDALQGEHDAVQATREQAERERDDAVAAQREVDGAVDPEHQEASARISELEVWSAELERRLAETTTLLSEAQVTAEHDSGELRRLRGELAEAEAHVELARAEIVSLSGPGDGSKKRLEKLSRKAAAEADRKAESDPGDAPPDESA